MERRKIVREEGKQEVFEDQEEADKDLGMEREEVEEKRGQKERAGP